MDITESKTISETPGHFGRLFMSPCAPAVPITPYVTEVSAAYPLTYVQVVAFIDCLILGGCGTESMGCG